MLLVAKYMIKYICSYYLNHLVRPTNLHTRNCMQL